MAQPLAWGMLDEGLSAQVPLGPPLPHTKSESRGRVKQWATKVRTGCIGCKLRRVKCDEGRPKCKSCTKRNTECLYKLQPAGVPSPKSPPPKGSPSHSQAPSGILPGGRTLFDLLLAQYSMYQRGTNHRSSLPDVDDIIARYRYRLAEESIFSQLEHLEGKHFPITLTPLGWEAMEAAAFFNKVVHRDREEVSSVKDTGHNSPIKTEPYDDANDIIIANALFFRIWAIADLHHTEARPEECYLAIHLWQRLHEVLASSFQNLSRHITDTDNVIKNQVFQRINDMIGIEDYLGFGTGRAHVRGFLSLLRHLGSPAELRRGQRPGLARSFQSIVVTAAVGNTLTAYADTFTEIAAFSNDELVAAFDHVYSDVFPCPTALFRRILEVSRLRAMVAGAASASSIWDEACAIQEEIQSFEPRSWTESYRLPAAQIAYWLASVFKAAVSLFLWCCVPNSAGGDPWAAKCASMRATNRMALLGPLRNPPEGLASQTTMVWPLAVLGYAANEGSAAERELVQKILSELNDVRIAQKVLIRLQSFWYRRQGSWDDCWTVPLIYRA